MSNEFIDKLTQPLQKLPGTHDSPIPYRVLNTNDYKPPKIDQEKVKQNSSWPYITTNKIDDVDYYPFPDTNNQAGIVELVCKNPDGTEYKKPVFYASLYTEKGVDGESPGNTTGLYPGQLLSVFYQFYSARKYYDGDIANVNIKLLNFMRKVTELRAIEHTDNYSESKIDKDNTPSYTKLIKDYPDFAEIEEQFLDLLKYIGKQYYNIKYDNSIYKERPFAFFNDLEINVNNTDEKIDAEKAIELSQQRTVIIERQKK